MIDSFKLVGEHDLSLDLFLDGNKSTNVFMNNRQEDVNQYYKSTTKGVKWRTGQKWVVVFINGLRLFGVPSPCRKKICLIYPSGQSYYAQPRNAVILNEDGSFHLQLPEPLPISKIGKEHFHPANVNGIEWLWYDHVSWLKHEDGIVSLVVRIGFNRDWYEERILDPETGELGACVGSGRF